MMMEDRPPDRNRKHSGLAIARGIFCILFALLFGFIASQALPIRPTEWNEYTYGIDTIWRTYFLAMLTLCVVAFILGVLSLVRPAAHPVYSVVAGAAVIVVGVVGWLLGFLPVGNGSDISPTLLFFVAGGLFAFGGVIVTLLSGTTLAVQRRSRARPPSGPQPFGAQSGSLGLRLFARLIDGFLVAIVAMPLAFEAEAKSGRFGLVPALLFGLFFGLLAFAYVVAFEVSQGWTLGKKLLGMQVHGPSGAAKPTVRQSAVRNAFILLVIIPYVGGLLVIVA